MQLKNKEKIYEIVAYLIFGVLTTAVSMITYFGILSIGEYVFDISPEAALFNVVRVVAEILQWVFSVAFAFFTNKRWVFKNSDKSIPVKEQLLKFSASRLVTLGLDAVITFGTVWLLQGLDYHEISLGMIGLEDVVISADLISKILAAVVVVISNYVFSKMFVFKEEKQEAKSTESK